MTDRSRCVRLVPLEIVDVDPRAQRREEYVGVLAVDRIHAVTLDRVHVVEHYLDAHVPLLPRAGIGTDGDAHRPDTLGVWQHHRGVLGDAPSPLVVGVIRRELDEHDPLDHGQRYPGPAPIERRGAWSRQDHRRRDRAGIRGGTSTNSPDCSGHTVISPIPTRTSRSVGYPMAAVIRRT